MLTFFCTKVERQFIKKLEYPYSECISDLASYGSELYKVFENLGKEYTQSDCFDLCYQTYIANGCGCIDPTFYPLPNQPYCLNLTQLLCNLNSFLKYYLNPELKAKCGKKCPLECDSENFVLTTSLARYPTRSYADQLVNHTNLLSNFYPNVSAVTYEQLKDNILAIEIFYVDMKYTVIEELEKMGLVDVVSGVGGTLGLFLGMSFMSFFEIIDVIIEIITSLVETKFIKRNKVFFVKPKT